MKHPIPEYVTRGKTIRQLIKELSNFENQDLEVRLSLDAGDSHRCISIVEKHDNKYCVLVNSEAYHENECQEFLDKEQGEAS